MICRQKFKSLILGIEHSLYLLLGIHFKGNRAVQDVFNEIDVGDRFVLSSEQAACFQRKRVLSMSEHDFIDWHLNQNMHMQQWYLPNHGKQT